MPPRIFIQVFSWILLGSLQGQYLYLPLSWAPVPPAGPVPRIQWWICWPTWAESCCADLKIPSVTPCQFFSARAAVVQWEGAHAWASGLLFLQLALWNAQQRWLCCGWGCCWGVFISTHFCQLCCAVIPAGRWLWASRSFKMSQKIPHGLFVRLCIVPPSLVSIYYLSKWNCWMKGMSSVVKIASISGGLLFHLFVSKRKKKDVCGITLDS